MRGASTGGGGGEVSGPPRAAPQGRAPVLIPNACHADRELAGGKVNKLT